jgi:hypothetical protein
VFLVLWILVHALSRCVVYMCCSGNFHNCSVWGLIVQQLHCLAGMGVLGSHVSWQANRKSGAPQPESWNVRMACVSLKMIINNRFML